MRKGFTLVEIIIVIAVLGILLAVFLPNWSSILGKADGTSALAEAQAVANDLLAVLLDEHGDSAADLLIFIQKGSSIFAFGYDASQTKLLQCRHALTGSVSERSDTVESLLKAAAIDISEDNPRYLWRLPLRFNEVVKTVAEQNGCDIASIAAYAVYSIQPVNFDIEAQHPSDCAHTGKKIELKASAATCSTEGCELCFICNDCGALFSSDGSTPLENRIVASVSSEDASHIWYYEALTSNTHRKGCLYCGNKVDSEHCIFDDNESGKCPCGNKNPGSPSTSELTYRFENGLLYKGDRLFSGLNESDLALPGYFYYEGLPADGEIDGRTFSEGRLVILSCPEKCEDGYLLRMSAECSPQTTELVYRFPLLDSHYTNASYTICADDLQVVGLCVCSPASEALFSDTWTQDTLSAYVQALDMFQSTQYSLEEDLSVPKTPDYDAWESLSETIRAEFSYNAFIRYKYGALLHRTENGFQTAYFAHSEKKYAAYAFAPQEGCDGLVIYTKSGSNIYAAIWTEDGIVSGGFKVNKTSASTQAHWTLRYDSSKRVLTVENTLLNINTQFTFHSEPYSGDHTSVTFQTPEPEALLAYAVLPSEGNVKLGTVGEFPTLLEYLHRALWAESTLCQCSDGAHTTAKIIDPGKPFHLYSPLYSLMDRFHSPPVLYSGAEILVKPNAS